MAATAEAKQLVKDYNELQKRIERMRKEFLYASKEVFKEGFQPLFDKFPILERVQWTQYTPYFNDGDECVFSTNTSNPDIYFKSEIDEENPLELEDRDYDDYEGDFSSYKYYDGHGKTQKPKANLTERQKLELAAGEAVKEFLSGFSEDQYKMMFEDHARVVVTSEGVEVQEYEHD